MADDVSNLLGDYNGPTTVYNGQTLPLINIKPGDIAAKVVAAANKHGVDPDFALKIAHTESGLNPNATSPKGAKGVMQLMPNTAKSLGVDPHNIDENIDGGVRYIKQLQDQFGDPALTAAAYNAGPGAMEKHGGIPPYPETQDYVQKVTGEAPVPSPDQLRGKSAATVSEADLPSPADLRKTNPNVKSVDNQAPQQSPGFSNALEAYQNNQANKQLVQPIQGTQGSAFFNNLTNSLAFGTMPALQGIGNALNAVGQKLAGKHLNYSVADAYNAARQAELQKLQGETQAHPGAAIAGQIAGFATSPASTALGVALPSKLATALPATAATRYGLAALGAGAAGAGAGAGQAISEGGSPTQIAKSAAINAAVSAPFGPLGEAASGVGSAFKTPVMKTLSPIAAHSALGAVATGIPAYLQSHNVKTAGTLAGIGAAIGASGRVASAKEAQKMLPEITNEDKLASLSKIGDVIGNGNPEAAAQLIEQAPGKTAIEAIKPEHRESLMQSAGELNPANLGPAQEAIAAHQNPNAVKGRLKEAVTNLTGEHPDTVSERLTLAPHQEAQQLEANANREDLVSKGVTGVSSALGVDPRTAESDWEGIAKNNRETVSSPLWDKVETSAPVDTEEHKQLLANEPYVRQALLDAKRLLGPEAEVPNPNYKPTAKAPNVHEMNDEELANAYKEAVKSGKLAGNSFDDLQQYLNDKYAKEHPSNNEPETLPTQKAWIQIERNLRRMVPRNQFGSVNYSDPRVVEIQQTQKAVNEANKQHFEGLSEAKAASGEDKASLDANENAYDFNPKSLNSETAEKFIDRYNNQGEMQQKATRYGYLQRFFQKFRENPVATAKEYLNSDQHQKVIKAMFGDKATSFNDQLKNTIETERLAKEGGPVANTISNAQKVIKSENIADFNHAYENADHQELYRDAYTDLLNQKVNNIRNEQGNIEPSHLRDLENVLTSDFHREVQDKLYGKDKADEIRGAIRQELDSAKLGKDISSFEPNPRKEGEALKPTTSAVFGALSKAGQGIGGIIHGGALGYAGAKAYEAAQFAAHVIGQGEMTPGARRALGEYLAKPKEELAADLREAAAKKRNIQMSKSAIKDTVAKRAALGTGLSAGGAAANAFTGIDENR